MGNVWKIARKEFVDLLSSRMVLIVLVAFLINTIMVTYMYYEGVNNMIPGGGKLRFGDNPGIAGDNFVFFSLSLFGIVIGIIVGCSSIASERIGNALNTLATKPLYRYTIINGKLIGIFAFLSCVMIFFTFLFTLIYLAFCSNAIIPHFADYLCRLPFVIIVAMACVLVFLTMSMLIALLVKDQAFALIISAICAFVSDNMVNFSYYLDTIFPNTGLTDLSTNLSPQGLISFRVQDALMNTMDNSLDAFASVVPQLIQLVVYALVFMTLSYIIFLRRDIS